MKIWTSPKWRHQLTRERFHRTNFIYKMQRRRTSEMSRSLRTGRTRVRRLKGIFSELFEVVWTIGQGHEKVRHIRKVKRWPPRWMGYASRRGCGRRGTRAWICWWRTVNETSLKWTSSVAAGRSNESVRRVCWGRVALPSWRVPPVTPSPGCRHLLFITHTMGILLLVVVPLNWYKTGLEV